MKSKLFILHYNETAHGEVSVGSLMPPF